MKEGKKNSEIPYLKRKVFQPPPEPRYFLNELQQNKGNDLFAYFLAITDQQSKIPPKAGRDVYRNYFWIEKHQQ